MAGTAAMAGTQSFAAQKRRAGHVHDEGPKCGIHICFNGLARFLSGRESVSNTTAMCLPGT